MKKLLIFCLLPFIVKAEDNSVFWHDVKDSVILMGKGSYKQFQSRDSQLALMLGTIPLLFAFREDDHYSQTIAKRSDNEVINSFNSFGTVASFPIFPGYFYLLGRKNQDPKMIRFAKELFATTYLAQLEASLISRVHIHHRPETSNLNFWETEFRGDSSFPSGHIIPFAALTFKAAEFYGIKWAIVPGIFTLVQSYQRIQDRKHYLSDVVGGIVLTAMAGYGVSLANSESEERTSYFNVLPYQDKIVLSYTKIF